MSPSKRALCAVGLLGAASAVLIRGASADAPVQTHVSELTAAPELAVSLVPAATEPIAVTFAGASPGLTYYESRVDPQRGGHVRGPDGVEISVPPGVIVDALGEPMTEPVAIRWALLDEIEHVRAPGGRLTTPTDAGEVPLQSYGMVDLQLHTEHGVAKLVGAVDLSFPIRPEFQDSLGGIGVYHLDPTAGTWERTDSGRISGGRFVVRATDTGFWNCDEPLTNRGCVVARFEGDVPPNTQAWLVGIREMYSMVGPVTDGEVCLDGPPGKAGQVQALRTPAHTEKCRIWKSETVQLSPAGTSCATSRSACSRVVLTPAESRLALCEAVDDENGRRPPRLREAKPYNKMRMLLRGAFGKTQ